MPNLLAGLTVAVVALPLALAFGLIAFGPEVGPAAGLWSAILAGFLAAMLGGSVVNITGPTVVLAVFTGALVADHGGFASSDALTFGFMAVALSGVFQLAFGALRLAKYIELVPYPVITGYMNGIALLIFWSGVQDILAAEHAPTVADALRIFVQGAAPWPVYAAGILAALAVALSLLWPRLVAKLPERGAPAVVTVVKRVPGSLVALLLLGLAALTLSPFSAVPHVGALPRALPTLHLDLGIFARHPEWIRDLLFGALGLAVISSMESLLSVVIADSVTGGSSRGDQELAAQGVANVVAGSLGANQASGAAVRTMVSLRNGGSSRLAGMSHALILLALLLVGAKLATFIPLAVLSGILIATGIGMIDWRALLEVRKAPATDTFVMVATTFTTVAFGIIEAVLVGVVLSAFLFIRRMSELTDFVGEPEFSGSERAGMEGIEDQVLVYEIRGPLFFGPAARFTKTFERASLKGFRVVIFRMNAVTVVDETGLRSMQLIVERLQGNGQTVILSHVPAASLARFRAYGLVEGVGPGNVVPDFPSAVQRARALLDRSTAQPHAF